MVILVSIIDLLDKRDGMGKWPVLISLYQIISHFFVSRIGNYHKFLCLWLLLTGGRASKMAFPGSAWERGD
jgi:hypothetical protein